MGRAQRGRCYREGQVGHGAGVRDFLPVLMVGSVVVPRLLIGPEGPEGVDGRVGGLTPDVTGHVGRS